jgi:carbon-monoxide dehydrogenase medium subunit
MKLWNRYFTPKTIDEAAAILAEHRGGARVIAGGTDLLVEARANEHDPFEALVDITSIPDMTRISHDDASITIGAGVSHTQIVRSPLLQSEAICLVEGCSVIGGPQVRNVATLGGNVAHALPAGDGTTALVVLDAEADILFEGQRQWVGIRELFRGPGVSLLNPTRDLLIAFRFRRPAEGEATAFDRIMRPQGVALPVLSCAVWIRLDAARSTILEARVCVAPAGPVPMRLAEVEAAVTGASTDAAAVIAGAQGAARRALALRTSKYRATADYRHEMADVLLERTLGRALQRAGAVFVRA